MSAGVIRCVTENVAVLAGVDVESVGVAGDDVDAVASEAVVAVDAGVCNGFLG